MVDVVVKVPSNVVKEAVEKYEDIPCLRRNMTFSLMNDGWDCGMSCHGYGNGFGVGVTCKEDCRLRITDLSKTREVSDEELSTVYLVQDDFSN